jgi:predicted outer membrane lipoprotein
MQVATLLLFFASPDIGGLGLRPQQIALYLLLRPICFVTFELACFGRMSKRAGGLISLTRIIVWLFPLLDIVYLIMAHCATSGYLNRSIIVGGLGLSLIIQTVANAAWVCCDVTTSSRAPTAEQLSTIVSFSEMTAQFALGLGTLIGSSLFAISAALDNGFLKGKLGWIIMCAFAILQALIAGKLEHIDGWKEKLLERAQ